MEFYMHSDRVGVIVNRGSDHVAARPTDNNEAKKDECFATFSPEFPSESET